MTDEVNEPNDAGTAAELDVRLQKAFDFSADLTKQLITLATAIITLTITFSKDFLHASSAAPRWIPYVSWYCFLASIGAGILALSAMTGHLDRKDKTKPLTIFAGNI
jgi:hypothetical protein